MPKKFEISKKKKKKKKREKEIDGYIRIKGQSQQTLSNDPGKKRIICWTERELFFIEIEERWRVRRSSSSQQQQDVLSIVYLSRIFTAYISCISCKHLLFLPQPAKKKKKMKWKNFIFLPPPPPKVLCATPAQLANVKCVGGGYYIPPPPPPFCRYFRSSSSFLRRFSRRDPVHSSQTHTNPSTLLATLLLLSTTLHPADFSGGGGFLF